MKGLLAVDGALIAMSGGVDSSVAALLAVTQGFDCAGGMMKLIPDGGVGDSGNCDSSNLPDAGDAEDARYVADILGIPFYVFDFTEEFEEHVLGRFVREYESGRTPNPCIDCNRHIKFTRLYRQAMELGREYIVTGHYANIEKNASGDRFLLKKGADRSKDQSYVLYTLSQEQLRHTLFPLGGMVKSQVREIAHEHGFINADRQESQDICFVRDGGYAEFIRLYTGRESQKGRFVDTDGADLGENKGVIHYTVGQRKGLGLSAGTPLYVCALRADDNTVVVGTRDKLYGKTLEAKDINLIPFDRLDTSIKVRARIRYQQPEQPATVQQLDPDTLRIEFDEPQRAITKGQAVVMYDGDIVIGGGTIC